VATEAVGWTASRPAEPRADRMAREPAGRTPRDGRMDPRADWLDPL